jgi:hypothetical protein
MQNFSNASRGQDAAETALLENKLWDNEAAA